MFLKKKNTMLQNVESNPQGAVLLVGSVFRTLTWLFLLLPFSLSAQKSVIDVLNEMPETSSTETHRTIPLKSDLPDFFLNVPLTGFIGISDPAADSAKAYQQAYLRALSMYAMQQGVGRSLSDYYTKEDGLHLSSKYEEMCELKVSCRVSQSSISLSTPIRLSTGEVILFLNVDSTRSATDDSLDIQSSVFLYYNENASDDSRKLYTKLLLENSCKFPHTGFYLRETLNNLMSDNSWVYKATTFNKEWVDNSRYRMFYSTDRICSEWKPEDNDKRCQNTFDGLWYALITSVYHQFSMQLKQQTQKETRLGEQYHKNLTGLNREKGFYGFQCRLESLEYCNNALIAHTSTQFPNP